MTWQGYYHDFITFTGHLWQSKPRWAVLLQSHTPPLLICANSNSDSHKTSQHYTKVICWIWLTCNASYVHVCLKVWARACASVSMSSTCVINSIIWSHMCVCINVLKPEPLPRVMYGILYRHTAWCRWSRGCHVSACLKIRWITHSRSEVTFITHTSSSVPLFMGTWNKVSQLQQYI